MKKSTGLIRLICSGLIFTAAMAIAQVPSQLNTQGRVSVDGTNFNGTAQFQFALVDGGSNLNHQATATATVSGGFMTIVTVDEGGDGYVSVPAVAFSGGGGSGAAATAQLGGGVVTNIVVDNPGSGYATAPDVILDAPPANITYEVFWTNGAPMNVTVVKGLYSVALGDTTRANMKALPPEVFTNSDVRLRVTFDDGVHGPEELSPHSRIASAGYALMAGSIQDGAVSAEKLADDAVEEAKLADDAVTGAKIADTAVDTAQLVGDAVTSDKIADGTVAAADLDAASFSNTFWKTDGNAGTVPANHFLGTTDNRALEIRVNNQRVLRIDPAVSPRWAAGYTGNVASAAGSVVVGGGNVVFGPNQVFAPYSSIGGGVNNMIESDSDYSFIGGGYVNKIQTNTDCGVIAGGNMNKIQTNADYSAIAGGYMNEIQSDAGHCVIGGGVQNKIQTNADYSVINGGYVNTIELDALRAVIGGGQNNTIESGSEFSVIDGGSMNTIISNSHQDVIGGGGLNIIGYYSYDSAIGGGYQNTIGPDGDYISIGGGQANAVQSNADWSVIGGGHGNQIQTNSGSAVIAGGYANTILTNANNSAIGGGSGNEIQANSDYNVIAGGSGNMIEPGSDYGFIGGGEGNIIRTNANNCVIGGGSINKNSGVQCVIGGGRANKIHMPAAYATIAGGVGSVIEESASYASIGGGYYNTIESNAWNATIPGGRSNWISVDCDYAFAAGYRAKAEHKGVFVWADSQNTDFASTASNEVAFRCQGGVRFNSGTSGTDQEVSWVPGDASWTFTSDQEKKEGFQPVDTAAVLQKVADLPIQWWVYKGYDVQHIGPMAQDFHAAFDVGRDQKGLDGADLDGVALAAIQALAQENDDLKARLAEAEQVNAEQDARLTELEQQIQLLLDVALP